MSVGFTIKCGKCRASWYVDGDPVASLAEHRAPAHADEDLGRSPLEVPVEREVGEDDGP